MTMLYPEALLIDDDADFCSYAVSYFGKIDLPIMVINDSRLIHAINFDKVRLLLLDIGMPYVSGLDVLQMIPFGKKPVTVMISGFNDIDTRIHCLELGADFFLAKPVDLKELSLIAKRCLERSPSARNSNFTWLLCRSSHKITTPDGRVFGLSSSEFRVLELLMRAAPNEVGKEDLSQAASGNQSAAVIYGRSLEVLISRLRSRLSVADIILPIKSVRNVGYVFHGMGEIREI